MEQHELNSIPAQTQTNPDAEEAERRKKEALARMDLLIMQNREKNDATHSRHRNRMHINLNRQPKTSHASARVDLAELMRQYKVSPEALERFEMQHISKSKGIVRPAPFARLSGILSPLMLMLIAWVLTNYWNLHLSAGVYLVFMLALLPVIYYFNVWKLEYDFASGMVQYHSLFQGTHYMNMCDMMCFSVTREPDMPFPFSLFCTIDPRKFLVIRTAEVSINIPMDLTIDLFGPQPLLSGFEGAADFLQALERYADRDMQKLSGAETPAAVSLKKEPAVQREAVIPALSEETPPAPVKPEKAPQTKPVVMPATPEPQPAAVKSDKKPAVQPLPERPAMPERSDAFPDPTGGSFPDPAQKPKPDADALFAQVLRDYGKL